MATHTKDQEQIVIKILLYKPNQYYQILSVEKLANESEIKKSYRKLAIKLHPDKNPHPRADEAFKLLNKAWGILSDPSKKSIFDQTGTDPDSRAGGGGGGSAATSHPFAGFQRAGGGGGGGGFDDDIFNMFFGGNQGTTFSFGGNGFSFQQFGGDGNIRQRQQREQPRTRRANTQANGSAQELDLVDTLKQLLPIFFVLLVPILSGLFSGSLTLPKYSFEKSPKFQVQRQTPQHKIPFYVTELYVGERSPKEVKTFDSKIESIYLQDARAKCSREQLHKNQLIEDAQGWFFPDIAKLDQANRMPMPNCQKLRALDLL